MSHPARDPRSGIDGQANAAGGRYEAACAGDERCEAERMSHPARDPRSGIDGQANAAGGRGVGAWLEDE
jgi:hypothetical protein